ncbi:hypothetical protein V6O07_07975, partial [Arthrospira platensis SPKY2]
AGRRRHRGLRSSRARRRAFARGPGGLLRLAGSRGQAARPRQEADTASPAPPNPLILKTR